MLTKSLLYSITYIYVPSWFFFFFWIFLLSILTSPPHIYSEHPKISLVLCSLKHILNSSLFSLVKSKVFIASPCDNISKDRHHGWLLIRFWNGRDVYFFLLIFFYICDFYRTSWSVWLASRNHHRYRVCPIIGYRMCTKLKESKGLITSVV